jgi:hypothetical protein
MTNDEYRAALDKLGINQQAAGRIFAVGQRTAGRWAQGQARVPVVVAMLLNLMVKKKLKLEIPIWNEEIRDFDRTQIWRLSAERKLE